MDYSHHYRYPPGRSYEPPTDQGIYNTAPTALPGPHYSSHFSDFLRIHQRSPSRPPMLYRTMEKMWGAGGHLAGNLGNTEGTPTPTPNQDSTNHNSQEEFNSHNNLHKKLGSHSPTRSVDDAIPMETAASDIPISNHESSINYPSDATSPPINMNNGGGVSLNSMSHNTDQDDNSEPETLRHSNSHSESLAPHSPKILNNNDVDVQKMEICDDGTEPPESLSSGISSAMGAQAALLQQTMSQLLRASPRSDSPNHLQSGENPLRPYWGSSDLKGDPQERPEGAESPSFDANKSNSGDKGDSGSGTSGFPPKSPPLGQFNMPAELFQAAQLQFSFENTCLQERKNYRKYRRMF